MKQTIESHLNVQQATPTQIQDGARDTGSPILKPEVGDSQNSFQSTDMTPATDASISTMLERLKAALCSDIQKMASDIRTDIQALGDRTAHLEEKTE
ncbi:Hypothetical predicted protein, partial [Pelobates cultripes]